MTRQPCWGLAIDGRVLADAFHTAGPEGYWRERLVQMDKNAPYPAAMFLGFATVHCWLGDHEVAIDYLERLVDARAGGAVFIAADNALAPLRGRPRFEALLKRIGGPQLQTV